MAPLPRLPARAIRVILPDFRAHGDSSAPHEASHYPADVLAMDVEALIRHLEPGNFVLGGYSLGARTAVRLLARGLKPERVILGGMGLAGITGGTERARFFLDVLAAPDSFEKGTPGYFAAQFLKQNNIDTVAAAHVLRSQLATPLEVVRGLETPALVICGAEDQDNGSAAELAEALPNAALVDHPRQPHERRHQARFRRRDRSLAGAPGLTAADHQPVADIQGFGGRQVGVAALPVAGFQIARQPRQPGLKPVERPEGRAARADMRVEIGVRTAPIGVEKAVAAIMRHRHGADLHRA